MSLSATGMPCIGPRRTAALHLRVGLGVPPAGQVGRDGDVARDLVIHGFDALQESVGERRRGDLATRQQAAGLGNAEQGEVGHGWALLVGAENCGGSAAQAQWVGMRCISSSSPT
jgi:hypothetical protein